ncbi:MAG: hypothetical protein JKY19_12865, partial [Alcanivoracaceae bacterium]|nr:hypothetical protein [Alcanivoracaceae bacterium]
EVNSVLKQIKADKIPVIDVYNKIDLSQIAAKVNRDEEEGLVKQCWLSAETGAGVKMLLTAIEERFNRTHVLKDILLPAHLGKLRAIFYQWDAIRKDNYNDDNSWSLRVELAPEKWKMLAARDDECGKFIHQIL